MRTTLEAARTTLIQRALDPRFDRVELAAYLIEHRFAETVAIADLGQRASAEAVTTSLVVRGRSQASVYSLINSLARGPLEDFARPDPRALAGLSAIEAEPGSEFGPELRLLEGAGGQVRTYLGLFGRASAVTPSRTIRSLLTPVLDRLRDFLRRTMAPRDLVRGRLMVNDSGQVLTVEPQLNAWLNGDDRQRRLGLLLKVARCHDEVDGPLDGARVTLRRATGMVGDRSAKDGCTVCHSWLGEIWTPEPLEVSPDALLTPMQRQVASFAAAGATCAEIGRTLGIKVETVRSHVRDIYGRLGIGSRAELARRLETTEARAA